jgi:sugar/nucleoside kinase (ribokinase family)
MSIVVLGTVAFDTVRTPRGERAKMLGGSAVHFSMAARLFTDVNLVAIVGKDFPKKHVDFLEKKGINLSSLIRTDGETFAWQGKYEGDLNTALTLDTRLGVLLDFKPAVSERQRDIKYIFLANVDPSIQNHLLDRMRAPKFVGLDSMNYWISTKQKELRSLLGKVTLYVANDQEARSLSGETNLVKAARYLCSLGPKMVIIKKGEHGVLFYSENDMYALPAYPVDDVVDPTGAGDTFAGGFMGYLAKAGRVTPLQIKKALVFGTIAASFNVEDFGCDRTSVLTLKDLRSRIARFRQCVTF